MLKKMGRLGWSLAIASKINCILHMENERSFYSSLKALK